MPDKNKNGFTLVELSIVLIIIGLIISGILVGQDLIHAAQVRATMKQLQSYNTAANAFRDKYGGLPGDLLYSTASQLGFLTFGANCGAGAGSSGCGNGNGLIEGLNGTGGSATGEELAFWLHLSQANMIDGAYGMTGVDTLQPNGTFTGDQGGGFANNIYLFLPAAKLGNNTYFVVFTDRSYNYFGLGGITNIDTGGTPGYANTSVNNAGLSPIDAYVIDTKLDDGLPNTGLVLSTNDGGQGVGLAPVQLGGDQKPSASNPGSPGNCNVGNGSSVTDTYDIDPNTGGNMPVCALQFRFN